MIKLYNTLTKKIEEFRPHNGDYVNLYTCGPTVYNTAHIGNLRSFILADLLYRTLQADGQNVNWVMNITDIDDKTIKGTIEEYGKEASVENLRQYTGKFLDMFLKDLEAVNVSVKNINFIRVTDVIPQIQKFIVELLDKGYAYKADDGSTYFSIQKYQDSFGDYGRLVGEKFLEGKKIGARVKVDEYDKDNLSDFALWKAWGEQDANIFWDHEVLGKGRPGWHIECSAINHVAFAGEATDIHTGGVDLVFPHHTNEIAQSQPVYEPFVCQWVHSEHLLVDGKKMSKSAGNFYTLKDIEAKGFSGSDLRYLFLGAHYRTQQNFTWENLMAARTARQRTALAESVPVSSEAWNDLREDLNIPKALGEGNPRSLLEYLGVELKEEESDEVPASISELLENRKKAKVKKDFAASDEIRKQIESAGYEVLDTPDGQKVKKKISI